MDGEKTKNIYIAISQTGTILSRIVKMVTRDKYNHVSISVKDTLDDLYSFGRINPYNPFHAGYVKESPTSGTFGRFKKTTAVIIEIPVKEQVYNDLRAELEEMYQHREEYRYNYTGLLIAYFGKVSQKDKCFYCSEFVQSILRKYGLGLKKGPKELVCPNDFIDVPDGRIIFTGLLRDYNQQRHREKELERAARAKFEENTEKEEICEESKNEL